MLKNSLKVSHLDKKVQCAVKDIDKVGSKFNEAVKKEYGAQFLKDASYILGFTEIVENKPEEDEEDIEKDPEVKDEEKDDSKSEKEELNESVKVQDLSKDLQVKTITPKTTKSCIKETESKKKKAKVGVPIETKNDDEGEEGGEDVGSIDEAETTASGAELKKKIIDNIARAYFLNQDKEEEKVELYDLPEFIDGKNVYFAKLSIKEDKPTS